MKYAFWATVILLGNVIGMLLESVGVTLPVIYFFLGFVTGTLALSIITHKE